MFDCKPKSPCAGIRVALMRDFASLLRKHLVAAIRYRLAFEAWVFRESEDHMRIEDERWREKHCSETLNSGKSHGGYTNDHWNEPTSPSLGRSSSRGRNRGIVRSDLEERIAIATLQAIESVKAMTKVRFAFFS